MKNQFLNLRVDTDTKLHLKHTAKNLQLSESEFIRKAIWEFETLLQCNTQALQSQERVTHLETTLRQLRTQMEAYEQNPSLKALFAAHKGQMIDGMLINRPSDLVSVLAQNARITLTESDSETQQAVAVVLRAQPAPSLPSNSLADAWEPSLWKRFGLLLLALLGTGILFLLLRLRRKRRKTSQKPVYPSPLWGIAVIATHL